MSETLVPLRGCRVVDFTEGVAGPFACQQLGDLGAEVIKVERPAGDWLRTAGPDGSRAGGSHFRAVNRNKRNICLDLRHPAAAEVAWRLAEHADVMISSFRPGVMDRLGFGFDEVHRRASSLVYLTISAYGTTGPLANQPGSDTVIQAASGLMSQIGEPDEVPYRVQVPVIDVLAARDAVIAVLGALLGRQLGGDAPAGPIDISLFASAATFQASVWQEYFETGHVQQRAGRRHSSLPPSGTYRTADDRHLVIAILRDEHFVRLSEALGLPELATDARFATSRSRLAHRTTLEATVADVIAGRAAPEWQKILRTHDVLGSPINELPDIVQDDALNAALPRIEVPGGLLGEAASGLGLPFGLGGRAGSGLPPPAKGEHTRELLSEVGYSPVEVAALCASGAAHGPEVGSDDATEGS